VAGQPSIPAPTPAASAPLTAALAGVVRLPMLALATNGIIPTGIGAIIPAGGGDLPPRARTLLATTDERPVSGALVGALDPFTLAPLPGTSTVHTDATGRYALAVPPGTANVIVEAVFRSPDGTRGFRLLTAARPAAPADISWSSTVAVTALLDAGGHPRPELAAADIGPSQAAAIQRLASLSDAEASSFFAGALAIDPVLVPTAALGGLIGSPPPAPLGIPSTVASTLPGVTEPVASALPGVTQPVASALGTVASALPSTLQAVTSTLPVVALPSPTPFHL
jgi:hypothetical protein